MASHNSQWNWTRYWLTVSSLLETGDAGFLPSNPSGKFRTLKELTEQRLLVLLGEPGSGKSVEIRKESERIRKQLGPGGRIVYLDGRTTVQSDTTLDRFWFRSEMWKDWQASSDDIWIFFDGFDESVQHIKGLSEIIRHELHQVLEVDVQRASKLFLRIASRTTGWQPELGDVLSRLLYPSEREERSPGQYTFHLAPPRWGDIAVAAESRGINGRDFCALVREHGAEALVLRPAQLEWLLNIFEAGGTFPEDKEQLYWEGMRQLCQDSVQEIDAEQLRAVAGRVAFVTMFGGLRSLWLDLDRGNVPANAILLSRFMGGVEPITQGDEVPVTQELLRALVTSGLFTSGGPGQAVWAHQTHPEYLAARYLIKRDLPLSQVTGLITNPLDHSQKVLPGMVEIAAWMASMSPEVRDHLLNHDPGALIDSDVALTDPEARERLVRAFLTKLETEQLVRTRWPQRGQYASLDFRGVGDVLKPFITNQTLRTDTRDTAIDIAVDCHRHELGEDLATIALDTTEHEVVRRSAAWAVTRLENDQARHSLKPLLAATADDDPFEELRGCALRANWPSNLSIHEVLEHLSVPKWHGFGAYRLFLSESFVQNMSADDLLPALEWLEEQRNWGEREYDLNTLETLLVSRALETFEVPEVFDWIVRRAVSNLTQYKPLFGDGTTSDVIENLLSSSERRQKLIHGMPRIIKEPEQLSWVGFMLAEYLRSHPAWLDEDFPWMVQQLHATEAASLSERFWLGLLRGTFSITNLAQTSLLFELYSDSRFTSQLADLFEPVDVRSPAATQQKESWYVLHDQSNQNEEATEPRIDIEAQITEILDSVESGRSIDWGRIDEWLKVNEHGYKDESAWITDITEQPGWRLCSSATQRRIIESAPAFLRAHQPDNRFVGTNRYYRADHAAYRALSLLLVASPEDLDQFPAEVWKKLGPLILSMHPQSNFEEIPHQKGLLQRAMEHGFDPMPWLVTMASRQDPATSYYFAPALNATVSLATAIQQEHMAERLIHAEMPVSALQESIRVLCERGVDAAATQALEIIKVLAQAPDKEENAATLVTVLMDCVDQAIWEKLWELLETNDDLFEHVVLSYTYRHPHASEFASVLDEGAVARLYQRLAHRFPPSEDPNIGEAHVVSHRESLGFWREELLSSLTMRGTWEAVEQLRGLAERFPDIGWLPIRIAQAEEEARRRTWQPPSIDQLMEFVRTADARLINSPQQLQDVIIESLVRYQSELSAETPGAADLWNATGRPAKFTPKDEVHISDNIKRFLDRDLKRSGIIVNREVENRAQNETDLYIQCFDSASSSAITVVCEVKGCWHRELYTSMSSQLYERYMTQQGLSHGIYVVAFFDGDRWDPADRTSRHKARRHSMEELRRDMVDQASELTDEVFHVTAVVLNCHY